jgi:UDP-N-acetyl-2-amino-2-deoxyglucuronate dehydrogenase
MAKSKLRFGIIGAGTPNQHIGGKTPYHGVGEYHASAIAEFAELVAIASRSESSARFLANKFGVKDIYTDYRQLLNRKDIDVVTIGTPSGTHGDIAIEAARTGKHIIIEKPIDVTMEKAERVVRECEKQKVKLSVAFHHRFGIVKNIKDSVDRGEIGKLILGNAFCKRYRTKEYFQSSDWRGTWALDGGGAFMNQGIHVIDSFQWIMGDVTSLFAYYGTLGHPYIEAEDVGVVSLKFKSGAFGIIEATTCCYPDLSDRIELHGEKGSIIADGYPMEIKLKESMDSKEKITSDSSKEQQPMYKGMHHPIVKDLIEAIEENREPKVNGWEGLKSLKIITSIYESSRKRKEITFD